MKRKRKREKKKRKRRKRRKRRKQKKPRSYPGSTIRAQHITTYGITGKTPRTRR